jgi:hypothetical protein
MRRPLTIWAAGIGSLVVLDVALDRRHDGSTLSECTRLIYRTDTPLGRCAFVASWLALSGWLLPHICKRARHLT